MEYLFISLPKKYLFAKIKKTFLKAHSLDDRKFNIFYEPSKGGTKNNKQFSSSHFSSFIPLKEMTRQNFVENNQEFLCRQEVMEKFKNQRKRREKNKWEEEERNGGGRFFFK